MGEPISTEDRKRLLPIKNAAEAAKRLGLRSIIVLQEFPDGQWGFTSYGDTRANCRRVQRIGMEALHCVDFVAESL